MTGAVGPGRAFGRKPHPVDEPPELFRADGDHIAHMVGESLAGFPAILHRREHRSEIEHHSIRILMMRPHGGSDKLLRRTAYLGHGARSLQDEAVFSLHAKADHRLLDVIQREPRIEDRKSTRLNSSHVK